MSIRRTPSVRSGPEARGRGSPAIPCTPVCRSCSIERAQGVGQCGNVAELRCHLRASQRRRLVWTQPKSEGPEAGQSWENLGWAVRRDSPANPPKLCPWPLVHAPSDVRLGPPAVLPASACTHRQEPRFQLPALPALSAPQRSHPSLSGHVQGTRAGGDTDPETWGPPRNHPQEAGVSLHF